MRKLIYIILILLCLSALTACTNDKNTKDTFSISIKNKSVKEIYGLHYEYFIDGNQIGGGNVENADNSILDKNEILTNEFYPEDFQENTDLSKFSIKYYLKLKDKREIPCNNIIKLNVKYNETYKLILLDSGKNGFKMIKRH
ncbi:hypothetical protein ANASTE_00762 [Anaerofustis stercorihominis DSM 17244]|uniref:Lipoprotein n=1 Tax=Anaerofustis stercorihominis DSM 17244 TaxID=445971 RepID=B1C7Q9_9FIRM|nr:hypothetical protein [Anaerofustis stercorihominis]EDS73046.1 hypothetical protein ANASTE_00762 [Anaerofustis stercorihominis DSM 17244]